MAGRPVLDLELEARVQRACRRLIREGIARSAHDCSDGGLAVTLAECCIAGGLGLRGTAELSGRWDAALFGELQSRIVVSLAPGRLPDLEGVCMEESVPWMGLGEVGGDSLTLAGIVDVSVAEIAGVWRSGLESAMHSGEVSLP